MWAKSYLKGTCLNDSIYLRCRTGKYGSRKEHDSRADRRVEPGSMYVHFVSGFIILMRNLCVWFTGFAFIPIVWAVGSAIGPLLGGTLSHPASLLPSVFDTEFWRVYPYFLPCLVTVVIVSSIFVVSAFFLKEVSWGCLVFRFGAIIN